VPDDKLHAGTRAPPGARGPGPPAGAVLVVGPEAADLRARDQLVAAGFDVVEAADAVAALTVLTLRDDVLVILTEFGMPAPTNVTLAVQAPWVSVLVTSRAVPAPGGVDLTRECLPEALTPAVLAAAAAARELRRAGA
jgi:hypothetical protein